MYTSCSLILCFFFAGQSEHDVVKYKLGYDIGPSNPFPTNEPEKEFYDAQRAQEEKKEAFEELKKQSEAEKKEREVKFRKENLIPESDVIYFMVTTNNACKPS